MKRALLLCLLAAGMLTSSGCMFMGTEDREFYGKGWMNPKELDKQPNTAMPMRPGPNDAHAGGSNAGGGSGNASSDSNVVVTERSSGAASLDDGNWATPRPH